MKTILALGRNMVTLGMTTMVMRGYLMANWGVAQAKAQFSAMLDKAEAEGPQLVRRRNRDFFVLTREQMEERRAGQKEEAKFVSAWDALRPSFDERYDDVEFPRVGGTTRTVDLE